MTEIEPFINPAQAITDLRNAVAWMEEHPWHQGDDYNPETQGFCAYGSIQAAVGALVCVDSAVTNRDSWADMEYDYEVVKGLRDRASNCARAFYRVTGTELTVYNDTEGRTKEQVITALRTVIKAIEGNPNRA